MKVCHMTSAHPVEDIRIFHKECVSLAKAGYEVYLVEQGDSYDNQGVHIIGVGDMPRKRIRRMTQGAKKVYEKALELDCDIYHLHDPELLPYALKLKKKGKKVVFDSHELYRKQIAGKKYLPKYVAHIVSFLYTKYETYVLKKIDGIIFPCLIDGEFPLPGNNRTLLNNVPSLEELYDKYDPTAEKDIDVCMVGTLSHSRGVTHLVKAAAEVGCSVSIGGRFVSEKYEKSIKIMAENKDISFLGIINREEVCKLLNSSQIGSAALLNVGQYNASDNLPTKAYEYMSMALPVILTKAEYNEKIIEKYRFGLCIDPENTTEYSEAIKYLLDHPDEARIMGKNGRLAIRNQFNWEKESQNLLNLYNKILST